MLLDVSGSLVKNDKVYSLKLPTALPKTAMVKLEKRNYPLMFISHNGESNEITVKLPENSQILKIPSAYSFSQEGTLLLERQNGQRDHEIDINSSWRITTPQIEPENYQEFRQHMINAAKLSNELLEFTLP